MTPAATVAPMGLPCGGARDGRAPRDRAGPACLPFEPAR